MTRPIFPDRSRLSFRDEFESFLVGVLAIFVLLVGWPIYIPWLLGTWIRSRI